MTHGEIAARLRQLARDKPTNVWWELHALAVELEQAEPDIEALVRATQPPTAPRDLTPSRPPEPPQTALRLATQTARNVGLVLALQLDARYLDTRSRRQVLIVMALLGVLAFAAGVGLAAAGGAL